MEVPIKKDPNLPEYRDQFQILNNFSNFVHNLNTATTSSFQNDAQKVIDCLKFIKLNLAFIGYAVEHRDDNAIYTYPADISKGVIRDFNNTAMHFNSYSSATTVKLNLETLVEQFEQAIEKMQEIGELEAFAKKLQFDGDIGCIEARTASALLFASTRLSHAPQDLDELMADIPFKSEDDHSIILDKAIAFFKLRLGETCLWQNKEYVINSALIKRYLIEILFVDLPTEIILDELKKKESTPHSLALIEHIHPQELAQTLLAPKYRFNFLQIIKFLLKKHQTVVCETLLKKLTQEGMGHFEMHFRDFFYQCFKKALHPHAFITFRLIKDSINTFIENRLKIGIFSLLASTYITCFVLALIGISSAAMILALLTVGSLFILPFISLIFIAIPLVASMYLLVALVQDFFRISVYTPVNAYHEFHYLTQNLSSDIVALQSDRLLALFFSNLSSQQLNTLNLNFKLTHVQESLPRLLFASNLLVAPEIEETFYHYWYSNSAVRDILIHNKYLLLTHCIDDYFEGHYNRPHAKIILLFEQCLVEKAKKQPLSDKEHAFLEDIKQENQIFPQKSPEEIGLSGVTSWSHYRHLRRQNHPSTDHLLYRLSQKNQLFGGAWTNEDFSEESLRNFSVKQERELEAYKTTKTCIEMNKGLAKAISPDCWNLFMKQLENPHYREPSLRKPITASNATKKFIHLTNEVVSYEKKRRYKDHHTHTKKTSTTLLSSKLTTPLFNLHGGLLFDRRQCKLKALLLQSHRTYDHKWIGSETDVNYYKATLRGINETDEERFIAKVQTSRETNEVLAKLNKEALSAIIIQDDTPAERLQAIQRRDEIESKLQVRLPILFYKPLQKLRPYSLQEQESDKDRTTIRGNRIWLDP